MSLVVPRAAMAVQRDPGFARVAGIVSPAAVRILHIGCGRGITALLLKLRRPDRHVTGVTANAEEASEAATRCDEVVTPGFLSQLPPRSFDCIIATDLPTGAADAGQALAAVLSLLTTGGELVIEALSAAHARVSGYAAGTAAGKGFTRRGLVHLLQESGCEVTSLRLDLAGSAIDKPLPLLRQPGVHAEQLEEAVAPRLFATAVFAEAARTIPVCSVILRPAASPESTLAALEEEARDVAIQVVIAGGDTAADLNRAVRSARGRYLAFLDAGTRPRRGWLAALLHALQTTPGAGVAGSVHVDGAGTARHGGIVVDADSLPYRHRAARRDDDRSPTADAVALGGMLIERSRFVLLGGFDERLERSYFDTDLCMRVRAHGRSVLCCTSAMLETAAGGTRDGGDAPSRDLREASREERYFADKWSPALEAALLDRPVAARPPGLELGCRLSGKASLVWSGHLFGAGGYAESTRGFVAALARAGVRTYANAFTTGNPSSLEEAVDFDPCLIDRAPRDFVSIVSRPAIFFRRHPYEAVAIGRTMNETDRIPIGWVERCNQMDQIWVPSRFNREAFVRSGVDAERVFVIPETIDERLYGPELAPLAIENVSGFVFLSVFLMGPRKGWRLLLQAYLDEFGRDEDVTLLLRVSPSLRSPLSELTDYIGEHLAGDPARGPRIVLCPANVEGALMPRLYRSADAFVLPSRGEGWGRPYMEAMASGLPTIGTGWSGNTDFMDADNSYLIDYALVPHNDPSLPVHFHTPEQTLWAEPSVDHLRRLMRTVFEERTEAARVGARARESVLDRFGYGKVAERIIDRLERSGIEIERSRPGTASAVSTFAAEPAARLQPECSVIVVAGGSMQEARDCVARLDAAAPAMTWEIVLVLCGDEEGMPPPDTAARKVCVVHAGAGAGESQARSLGAAAARGSHLVFLDSGSHPRRGWIEALFDAFQSGTGTGVVGSTLISADGSLLHSGFVLGPQLLPYPIHRGEAATSPAARTRSVSAVAGVGMLVPRKTLHAVGGFDPSLGGVFADADLCLRVSELGLDVRTCAESVLAHDERAGPGPRLDHEHSLRFLERWAPRVRCDDVARCEQDDADVLAARAASWPMPPRGRRPSARPPAILWSAPVFDRSGYANEARDYILALDETGADLRINPHPYLHAAPDLPAADLARLRELAEAELPDRFVHVILHQAIRFSRHPHALANIGRTMFETDSLPADRVRRCNQMDEVWVPSRFNAETFAAAGVDAHRLVVIPESIDAELYGRSHEPVVIPDAGGFVFLSVFAWSPRKGWDVLLRAYVEEFGAREDVTLVLAVSTNAAASPGDPSPHVLAYLRDVLRRDPAAVARIVVLPLALSPARMPSLYAAADAFVLPSRGEGWGRPLMEAMACGLPTIGTGWSGNTEFMNAGNSFLAEYELVDLPEDGWARPGMFRGQRWAEPSAPHLRTLLRSVFENREHARAVGALARIQILERYDRRLVARRMLDRIATITA